MNWLSKKELIDKIQQPANDANLQNCHGVYSMDDLTVSVPHYSLFMTVNTKVHNLSEQHWKTAFIDRKKGGEIFDSLALPLSNTLIR